ncbi:unnamed protein product [Rhizoctonia solani]|uniref:Uncharacterized protein n=1 Tax=Rhizoctonia solani TaxID=456999 RepID=A0A8H3DCD6_9AGAM|nr:unnamed protein product [Rhizoctonia solani]
MHTVSKFTVILVSALGYASSAVAAPVEAAAAASDLAARAPYDVHNGWATYYKPDSYVTGARWKECTPVPSHHMEFNLPKGTNRYRSERIGALAKRTGPAF